MKDTMSVKAKCGCSPTQRRTIPIHVIGEQAERMKRVLERAADLFYANQQFSHTEDVRILLDPNTVLATYRCPRCKTVIELTMGMLYLTPDGDTE